MRVRDSVIRVAVPVPIATGFDYLWQGPGKSPDPGCRVLVPLGKGQRIGIVLENHTTSSVDHSKLKAPLEVLDSEPIIGPELLAALSWCSGYYHHPIGEVVKQALPTLLRRGRSAKTAPVKGWKITTMGLAQDPALFAQRAPRQAEIMIALADGSAIDEEALRDLGITRDAIIRLASKGFIKQTECIERSATSALDPEPVPSLPELTHDQKTVLDSITANSRGFRSYLLQGVTGSGKTEVYMRLIAQQLKDKRQSLLLVPEIGLTPQLVSRLKQRFHDHLALMHSGLSDRERLEAWRETHSGRAKVIVGTRSAVFAPLHNPGLFIIDEEHDSSYKQQEGFRYSARDLAVFRAKQLGLPIMLASATPSLESFYNARQHRYDLLTMPQQIGAAGPPRIKRIDLNKHASRHGLSTPLVMAIEKHLAKGSQTLLFLNRRGFAPVLFCTNCQQAEECIRCDSRMTIHAASGQLRCHHCGKQSVLSWDCRDCSSRRIAVGAGTQRVTDELEVLFPAARIARLDRDIAARKGQLADVLTDVEQGNTQILVGTQMLTKGHDFPGVTLVGILNADQGLLGTDFRSNERLAQTLLQVAGRAGRRDKPGEVLIQTHYPAHPLLTSLIEHGYAHFAELALEERAQTRWPPFSHLAVWRAQAGTRGPASSFLQRIGEIARHKTESVAILGPASATMERRGGQYRAQLLFRCSERAPLHNLLGELLDIVRSWPEARRLRWNIDVDPTEL